MLGVGIHENLMINKADVNEQGTLVITITQKAENAVSELDFMDGVGDAGDSVQKADFYIYGLKSTDFQGADLDVAVIKQNIKELRILFAHILKPFYTVEELTFNSIPGTGITAQNADELLVKDDVLEIIYNNLVNRFIELATPHLNSDKLLRMLFTRRSAAKHFPAMRKKFLDGQPFVESMDIPADQSKLKFSKYEIGKGLNNPDPIEEEPDEFSDDSSDNIDDLMG